MAKPIKETPVLTGDDATRFEQAAQEVVPASQKEINEAKQAYSFFCFHSNHCIVMRPQLIKFTPGYDI